MRTYRLVEVQEVALGPSFLVRDHYVMSPFVWREGDRYRMALRIVQPLPDGGWGSSSIFLAEGDGLEFEVQETPILSPGPWPHDQSGCEDPTVFRHDGEFRVYYTGWNAEIHQAKLLFAAGRDIESLEKRGEVIAGRTHWNTKEATVAPTPDGWKLFFEYSDAHHSLIGTAWADVPNQDWHLESDPFGLRSDHWDSYHLSTGPMLFEGSDRPVMFYNGSDAVPRWRVGWVEFDACLRQVTARCEEPLIVPEHLPANYGDIAFISSVVLREDGLIAAYLSVGDRRLHRAIIQIEG